MEERPLNHSLHTLLPLGDRSQLKEIRRIENLIAYRHGESK